MNSDTSCGPAEFASAKTYRCEFCGNVNTDPARIEKCRELCRKVRAMEERAAAADPQTPEVLPAEKDAGPAAAAARGELLPRPMRGAFRLVAEPGAAEVSVAPTQVLAPPPEKARGVLHWLKLGYRQVHEHKAYVQDGQDPLVIVITLQR